MPQHKALLIGASEYGDPSIGDLPFVRDDLQRLREVLIGRGFRQADILESRYGTTQNTVRGAVHRFLHDAGRGDTLLILLSGHGVHFDGKDYLVPEDATSDTRPFTDSCIEIGWHKEVEASPAERVVFLIDACREGMELDTKAVPGTRRWQRPKIISTLRRKVAYVHACAKPQVALFVRESDVLQPGCDVGTQEGESFSIFSRAVSDVIIGDPHALRLREFAQQVQERVNTFHRAYGKPQAPQQVMVTYETDATGGDFPLLPGTDRRPELHPWVRAVDKHPVWHHTPEGPARETLRQICGALAGRLAAAYEKAASALGDDPWHDPELAARTHERLGFLVGRADAVRLSPTEAALAFLFPLVTQTFWAQEAAQRLGVLTPDPAAPVPDQARFHKFAQGFPRLKRRLLALEHKRTAGGARTSAGSMASDESTKDIQWWLFHRWLIQQPDLYTAERLKALLGDVTSDGEHPWISEALSGERLMRLLREHRTAPFTMRRATTDPVLHGPRPHQDDREIIDASGLYEQEVRAPLVIALTKAAYAMAVDPVDLPEIVVEHLGVRDSVDMEALRITVQRSDWQVSGLGRSLNAVCSHPAVQVALREHAARVDLLLRDINRGDNPLLAPLSTLPPYADGSRVRLDGNTPDQLSDGIRFQLAEDRVQELLMGEELYGDSELAVRELYQNALDAVRYRDRRTEYLRRVNRPVGWEGGRIEFVQGVHPDGRPYLKCRDNGIGMGITELSTVFSQGGARFVDLPEYIEEQAAWAELPGPKLELHPNSRFGIGVLSYFMLADEIVVRTCRLDREGQPGRLLQVTIAGPGNFFRVDDLGPGQDAGTEVELLLSQERRSVSCVEALQKVLWVAPYRTVAKHGAREHEWEPGVLDPATLERSSRYRRYTERFRTVCIPSGDADLWWIEGEGVVLADGLFTQSRQVAHEDPLYGVVVNLHGDHSPELTVDRKSVRSYDQDHVTARTTAAVASLTRPGLELPNGYWLEGASRWSMAFADCVAEHARRAELSWRLDDNISAPFSQVGFFPPDVDLLPLVTGTYTDAEQTGLASFFATMPLPVLRWRLRALYRTGLGGPVSLPDTDTTDEQCARPSDFMLLINGLSRFPNWELARDRWLRGPQAPAFLSMSPPSEPLTKTGLMSLGMLLPWRDPAQPLRTADLFELSSKVERPPSEVAERLNELGYRTESLSDCAAVECSDLPLLRPLGDLSKWLAPGTALSAAQICVSASQAGCSTVRAAERLAELGFTVPAAYPERTHWSEDELNVVKQLWSSYDTPPSPDAAVRVCAAQLTAVAHATSLTLRFVAELLGELGFLLPQGASGLPELSDDDRALLTHEPQILVDQEVPLRYVAAASRRLNRPARALAERLRELGYTVSEVPDDEQLPSREDIAFLDAAPGLSDLHRPVSLIQVAHIAQETEISPGEAVTRLASLGCRFAFVPDVVSRFRKQDTEALYFGDYPDPEDFGPVSPAILHAVALHTHQPDGTDDIAASLTDLGFTVVPPTEEWTEERRLEKELLAALLSPADAPPPALPRDPRISLVTLATVALEAGMSLRDVALKASAMGMRHEAETWFTPAPPTEPTAPSAAATPPPATAAPRPGC
ncbi:caspase family protein [Streptomyces sp. TRM70350]|uniref:caspase family protein n=1 Tax=Streptomyces sp. TRM70350 TaxID=2856165 RepID=UPI001C456755|nr:caspase family protein [Streptomyces sp. TRM70350]MBV7696747.1 caspase family protein [Streptomyces sp. TRM70350]